ncbi:MAG: glutaredoxin family protein [Cyanobium sp.]
MAELLLYTRQGCCLCEGLAEKLLALQPPPRLRLIDVDSDPALQGRFGLEVPLLAQNLPAGERLLPRVPPRLAGEQLLRWLKQQGVQLE